MQNYYNFINSHKNDPWETFNNPISTKQAKMFALSQLNRENSKVDNVLKQTVTWINTSREYQKDPYTGKHVIPRTIYAGKDTDRYPDYEVPVANIDKMAKANEIFRKGEYASSTEVDKALNDPFYPEFSEYVKRYNDFLLADESAAAPHTSQDFPLMTNVTVAGQVVIEQLTEFPLLGAVPVENTTELLFRRYKGSGFDIEAVVGELGTTEPKKMSFTKQEWYTRKSGGEIQWTDEHEMVNYFINPLQLARGQFAIAANKIKNTKVLKALQQFTVFSSPAGANLAAYTGEHSTNNPYLPLAGVKKLINYTNFGNLDTGAMNSATLFGYLGNTYIKGTTGTQGLSTAAAIPGFEGVRIVLDESLPDGYFYLFDSQRAVRRIQGPIRTEQYRLAREGGSGLVYRDWNDVQIRDLTKARYLSNLI